MPARDLALLETAARAAGDIALRFWKQSPKTWDKGNEGPVTEADLAVNDLLAATLRAARPDYGWLSEESPDDPARLSRDRCFIIDPIDGTRAFIDGQNHFAHALAVTEGRRVVAGVVYLPALDRLYSASVESIATVNGAPIRCGTRTDLDEASVLTTKANLAPEHWPGGLPPFHKAFRPSLAYRIALVAEGAHDAMLTFRPAWEWDIAAAALIAERSGTRITDDKGMPLRFNRPDPRADGVIAANPALHAALLRHRSA